jgi:hypothetical protein
MIADNAQNGAKKKKKEKKKKKKEACNAKGCQETGLAKPFPGTPAEKKKKRKKKKEQY